jgi:hypothetical protein
MSGRGRPTRSERLGGCLHLITTATSIKLAHTHAPDVSARPEQAHHRNGGYTSGQGTTGPGPSSPARQLPSTFLPLFTSSGPNAHFRTVSPTDESRCASPAPLRNTCALGLLRLQFSFFSFYPRTPTPHTSTRECANVITLSTTSYTYTIVRRQPPARVT